MQTSEHLDANATASELAEFLNGPVQPGDVDAMLEALQSAVPVAPTTPEAMPPLAANASDLPASRESCKPSAGACASGGTGSLSAPFLVAAGAMLAAEFAPTMPIISGSIVPIAVKNTAA